MLSLEKRLRQLDKTHFKTLKEIDINITNFLYFPFSAVFLIEVILKSIAYGFVMGHKNCYLRSYMNIIDFVAVFFSLFNIFITVVGDAEHLQFKTIRIIRVVRMLKISTNLKRVINCLVNSLQRITYFLDCLEL